MSGTTLALIDEVCQQFHQEGMTLTVTSLDVNEGRVELDLRFIDIECLDCVLPASYLERLIATKVMARSNTAIEVRIHDPRDERADHALGGGVFHREESVVVLDPTASGRGGNPDPGPASGNLRGKTVLFRVDSFWRSWDWTVEEWMRLFEEAGVQVLSWRRWQGIPGEKGRQLQEEYEGLVSSADLVISGLANCGSCSAWTIRDALTGLNSGLTSIAVVTEHFVPLARILAEDGYRPGLRLFSLPYPLDTRPEMEVREIARGSFPDLLTAIGAYVEP